MARLLVLDDDDDTLAWMVAALERTGHEVRGFAFPFAALEALKGWSPDLILADIVMTEMNGLEFARLTRDCHEIPLMFVSVANQRAEAVISGAFGYVQKPATATEVRAEVERVLARRGERNTLLIIDGDPEAHRRYHSCLDATFDVLDARNGAEAVDLLAQRRVDLAIIDVHVPSAGGPELIRRVRSTGGLEHLPIIVQTSDRSATSAPIWQELHVSHVFEKNELLEWVVTRARGSGAPRSYRCD